LKRGQEYRKHVYWLTGEEEAELRQELDGQGITLRSAKGIVCTPLDEINKVTSVAPGVWNETCGRQGSWYRASDKKGLYLIVSAFELKGYGERKTATLTESGFSRERVATLQDKQALVGDPLFRERVPDDWNHVEETEKRIYLRWARRFGSDLEEYDRLFLSHTANHANFVHPRFFTSEGNHIIPYSIDRTAHLCSSCVELFQILGDEFPKKLVAPCPGAAIFARLRPDRYLLVEKP
jgi:hypothetical protein